MQATDPLLLASDISEISDHLLDAGVSGVAITRRPDHLLIEAPGGDAAIGAALAGWVPTTSAPNTWVNVPPFVKDHMQHLRDYRTLVRGGGTPTDAQTAHVVADIIDALRWVNARITGD